MAADFSSTFWLRLGNRNLVVYVVIFIDLIFIIAMFGVAIFLTATIWNEIEFKGITKETLPWYILGALFITACLVLAFMDIAAMQGMDPRPAIFR